MTGPEEKKADNRNGPLPSPSPAVEGTKPYRVPKAGPPVDLKLDANEGIAPPSDLLSELQTLWPDCFRRYPDQSALEAQVARIHGIRPEQVLVTAGGDDGLERALRAMLSPGREMILPVPSFEMLERYARLAGAEVSEVPWPGGGFPIDEVIGRIGPSTGAVAVVSPNNPTGSVIRPEELERLSGAAKNALLVVDLAYTEFADTDLMDLALRLPNAVAVRSFSKAWGLAGLRVGYAAGPVRIIDWLRAAGHPYAVSRPSLAVAAAWLQRGRDSMAGYVARVREERRRLAATLKRLGADPEPSQANFVLARYRDPVWVRDALAGMGIGVRIFPGKPGLEQCSRITCPGDDEAYVRLEHALETTLMPEALLFDMDGVLADVSESYRRSILETASSFGVELDPAEISEAKSQPGANNDWVLTQRLLKGHGVSADLEEVTRRFEERYQGTTDEPGLRRFDRLIPDRGVLDRLRQRVRLCVVTGRPRSDARRFLEETGCTDMFEVVVCMEDGPTKPDPAPVRLALERMGVSRAWMVGDTPDDITAARGGSVLPLGIPAPGDSSDDIPNRLIRAGAARVLSRISELEELLP